MARGDASGSRISAPGRSLSSPRRDAARDRNGDEAMTRADAAWRVLGDGCDRHGRRAELHSRA
jgi:hypothetical protein